MSFTTREPKKRRSGIGRIILWIFLLAAAAAGFAAYKVLGPNTGSMPNGQYLYIHTGDTYEDVQRRLQEGGFVRDMWSFNLLADYAEYPSRVKAGKYKVNKGMSNYNLVKKLRSGNQDAVKLVINKIRTKEDLVRIISRNLEADSVKMRQLLDDPAYLQQFGLNSNTAMCAVIPDTYEFFWNTSADKAYSRLAEYYKKFWTEERRQKASAKNLSPEQAVIVASIVDEETNKNDEKGNVASVYLNRIKKGMPLQADPTVRFAIGDFTIRRINKQHLQYESPYNTYRNAGLPPGPICTPSKKSVEAVLNAPDTDYIYFCAKEDFSGYHSFAANYAEHMKNAKRYQQALNARGIR